MLSDNGNHNQATYLQFCIIHFVVKQYTVFNENAVKFNNENIRCTRTDFQMQFLSRYFRHMRQIP